jgi:hypothetical protein
MRGVDGDVVLGGEIEEDLSDLVDEIVVVLGDAVRFDEGVEADDVDVAANDGPLDYGRHCPALRPAIPVHGHQLAGLRAWRANPEPPVHL